MDAVKKMTPEAFEQLVVKLLVAMGYGGSIQDAGKAVGKAGDEGIDGNIKEDKLGLGRLHPGEEMGRRCWPTCSAGVRRDLRATGRARAS